MSENAENKTIEQEMYAVIEKKLSKQVGTVLKDRLIRADELENLLSSAIKDVERHTKTIRDLQQTISEHNSLDERGRSLAIRESEVSAKENKLEIDKLKYELSSEKSKSEFVKEVSMGLVRNSAYRTSVFSSENSLGYNDSNGNYVPPKNGNSNKDETKTIS